MILRVCQVAGRIVEGVVGLVLTLVCGVALASLIFDWKPLPPPPHWTYLALCIGGACLFLDAFFRYDENGQWV